MRILAAAIIVAPLMLMGAVAALGQSALAPGPDASVRSTASSNSTVDRDAYTHQARDDVQGWQKKLQNVGEKTETAGKKAGTAAEKDLHQAWIKTQVASSKLQTVGDEGWDGAKRSYEAASHELANTWHKIHPEDK